MNTLREISAGKLIPQSSIADPELLHSFHQVRFIPVGLMFKNDLSSTLAAGIDFRRTLTNSGGLASSSRITVAVRFPQCS
jgi:hypothetical protein